MAKCVFCGEKADYGKTIEIGDQGLRCCSNCYEEYAEMDKEDVARAVLEAGVYGYPWLLEEYLEKQAEKRIEVYEKQIKQVEEYNKWREGREAGVCPKCGGAMIKHDRAEFLTMGRAFLTIQMNSFNTDYFALTPIICEECGYTEFYSVKRRPDEPADPAGDEEDAE